MNKYAFDEYMKEKRQEEINFYFWHYWDEKKKEAGAVNPLIKLVNKELPPPADESANIKDTSATTTGADDKGLKSLLDNFRNKYYNNG